MRVVGAADPEGLKGEGFQAVLRKARYAAVCLGASPTSLICKNEIRDKWAAGIAADPVVLGDVL